MKYLFICLFMGLTSSASGVEITLKDNITGYNHAATSNLANQTAVAGLRQILFTPLEIESEVKITRVHQLSDMSLPNAVGFSYSVREAQSPYQELLTGSATFVDRTEYADITRNGDNTNLDELTIDDLTLPPGSYFFAVHASDGNAYQMPAHLTIDTEPLLAEAGGAPFFSVPPFHLYVRVFGRIVQEVCAPVKTSSGKAAIICF